jgi:hypothetical protein
VNPALHRKLSDLDLRLSQTAFLKRVDRAWAWARRAGFVLWLTRASLVMLLLPIAVFFTDQVSDAMVQLSESEKTQGWAAWLGFFAAETLWAFIVAYSARMILMFDFGMLRHLGSDTLVEGRAEQDLNQEPAHTAAGVTDTAALLEAEARRARIQMANHVIWWPRVYALLGPLGVALAQYSATGPSDHELRLMAAVSVAIGWGMMAFMTYRRKIMRLFRRAPLMRFAAAKRETPPIQPIFVRSAARNRDVDEKVARAGKPDLDPVEIRNFAIAAGTLTLLCLIGGILAVYFPERLTDFSSSPALIFLIIATWMPGLLLLVFISHWRAFPIFTGALLLAIILNYVLPDHHNVVLNPGDGRLKLEDSIERWKQANPGNKHPIIIATAGGGIRAAYWTATVLGALEDCPIDLARHTFAISGVSGGSIGAATYAALLQDARNGPPQCLRDPGTYYGDAEKSLQGFRQCGQAILSHNLLSAPLLALAYKDIFFDVTRLNALVSAEDRAAASERALQHAWKLRMGESAPGFEQAFLGVGPSPENDAWRPALIFNTTSSRTGERVIISSVNFGTDLYVRGEAPLELHDIFEEASASKPDKAGYDISLATSAFLSARFPLISPAGSIVTIDDRDQRPTLHTRLVDGGYFENFGAETAQDLFFILTSHGLEPIIIQISSDHELPAEPVPESWELEPGLDEVGAPLWAVFGARTARGLQATNSLQRIAARYPREDLNIPNYFHIRLYQQDNDKSAPLGWVLSKESQRELNNQLLRTENMSVLTEIVKLLNKDDRGSCIQTQRLPQSTPS